MSDRDYVLSRFPAARCVMTRDEEKRKMRHEQTWPDRKYSPRYWHVIDGATGKPLGSEGTTMTAWYTAAKAIRSADRRAERIRRENIWLKAVVAKWDADNLDRSPLVMALAFFKEHESGKVENEHVSIDVDDLLNYLDGGKEIT